MRRGEKVCREGEKREAAVKRQGTSCPQNYPAQGKGYMEEIGKRSLLQDIRAKGKRTTSRRKKGEGGIEEKGGIRGIRSKVSDLGRKKKREKPIASKDRHEGISVPNRKGGQTIGA